ncbi:hypothetical protein HYQ46_001815 [Verticillium longisporum]|nr:hypothetical protein HYQ46_001815 [Verticillium longisporum]
MNLYVRVVTSRFETAEDSRDDPLRSASSRGQTILEMQTRSILLRQASLASSEWQTAFDSCAISGHARCFIDNFKDTFISGL